MSEAAIRGEKIFLSRKAACSECHHGPYLTDGKIHDVGLDSPEAAYQGFNTPSLRGVYRKVRLLHDGRAKSLEALLRGPHAPQHVAGTGELEEQELRDLVEYLRGL